MESNEVCANKKPQIKPKVAKELGEDDNVKLIGLVETEKYLWDVLVGDKGYHKWLRDCIWRNIADSFEGKHTPIDLNAKWTNLRVQYRGYVGKAKTKSGQETLEAPKWRFFNDMSFVGRAEDQQTQKTTSNIPEDLSDSNSRNHSESSKPRLAIQKQPARVQRQPHTTNSQSVATQIAGNMRETVSAMTENAKKKQIGSKCNILQLLTK